jgi:L-ascorbate metabolism protein UlaG (beta-lactamase superfamily)
VIITWLGGNCFRLEGAGRTVVTDPPPGAAGVEAVRGANIVTFSGPDIAAQEGPFVISGPGEYEIRGTFVVGVATPGLPDAPANTTYCITFDDVTVCHLGSLGGGLSEPHREAIGAIDVLLAPVTGPPGITPEAALEVVNQLEPALVVPIHGVGLGRLDQFLREMGADDAVAEPTLEVNSLRLPDQTQVRVLEPRSGGR